MSTVKVMSIIGIVMSGFAFLCLISFNNQTDYVSGIGWGIILVFWTIAQSIVGIVQSSKQIKKEVTNKE